MDISDMTDIQALKAMAYDQMVLLEQTQRNLTLINARISDLQQAPTTAPTPKQA